MNKVYNSFFLNMCNHIANTTDGIINNFSSFIKNNEDYGIKYYRKYLGKEVTFKEYDSKVKDIVHLKGKIVRVYESDKGYTEFEIEFINENGVQFSISNVYGIIFPKL